MTSRARPPTMWERGRHPGRLVVRFGVILLTVAATASVLLEGRLGVVFDVVFVALCVAMPLWVRPGDFFTIGVLPPLLLTVAVTVLAVADRGLVAQPHDSFAQALVSGLAHHGIALALGYGLTLMILGLRQVARRNAGVIRPGAIRAAVVADTSVDADDGSGVPDAAFPVDARSGQDASPRPAPAVVQQRRPPLAEQLTPTADERSPGG